MRPPSARLSSVLPQRASLADEGADDGGADLFVVFLCIDVLTIVIVLYDGGADLAVASLSSGLSSSLWTMLILTPGLEKLCRYCSVTKR